MPLLVFRLVQAFGKVKVFVNLRSLQPLFTKLAKSHISTQFFVRPFSINCRELSHGSCTITLQVVSLIRRSSKEQHGTENNTSWLSTCREVIRAWLLKIQHGKPCHTFAKLDARVFVLGWYTYFKTAQVLFFLFSFEKRGSKL